MATENLHLPNEEQVAAIELINTWLNDEFAGPFFVLKGSAGTGKTFSLKHLLKRFRGATVFTAPTNKATKVLRESLASPTYTPECCTIYSLLGLKLEASGAVKEIRLPKDKTPNLKVYKLVVVDEGSMLNSQLLGYIKRCADAYPGLKFLFMGDAAQLPPVKELISPVWKLDCPQASLTRVMRHDNQILELVTRIRDKVDHPAPTVKLSSNFEGGEGVWHLSRPTFNLHLEGAAKIGLFSDEGMAKVIAWRNKTVDAYNRQIRHIIFGDNPAPWLKGDRLIFTEPAKNPNDTDEIVATTDDEGEVIRIEVDYHPIHSEFKCYALTVELDTGGAVCAWAIHPEAFPEHTKKLARMMAEAQANPRQWKAFWEFKESFHAVRHGYAITAHRSQGSTYQNVFVDTMDILANPNRQEAFRCLYVACSRPSHKLILV